MESLNDQTVHCWHSCILDKKAYAEKCHHGRKKNVLYSNNPVITNNNSQYHEMFMHFNNVSVHTGGVLYGT